MAGAGPVRRRTLLQAGWLGAAAAATEACSPARPAEGAATGARGIPRPAAMVRTSWATDPWALGAYSYLAVGATPSMREDLRRPVGGRLFLAGEATSTANPATVHGARASGKAAALELDAGADGPLEVVVVGAGAAGASAARRLADLGHSVVVVEARDRVGGRIATVRPDGWPVPVELGASWVHDTEAGDLPVRLRDLGVASAPFSYDAVTLTRSGRVLAGDRHLRRAQEALGRAIEWADDRERDLSLASALRRSGADRSPPRWLPHLLHTEVVTEYGADPDELSAWWGQEEGTEGDDLLVTGGYDAVVRADLDGLDVRLGWPVASVDHGGGRVLVAGADGSEPLTADRVVVTVPLAVLRAGGITFTPELPGRHRRAVAAIGTGLLDKVWFRWDRPWWRERAEQWTLATGDGRPWVEWFNLLPATGQPVLLGLEGGAAARAWSGRSDAEVQAAALRTLGDFARAGW